MSMHLERLIVSPGPLSVVLCLSLLAACKPERRAAEKIAGHNVAAHRESAELPLRQSLAEARIALAKQVWDAGAADHALLHAVSALEADPASTKARDLVAEIFSGHAWAMHEVRIHIGSKVDHLIYRRPDCLWVASSNEWNTVSKWNPETLTVEAVLFPLKGGAVRSMVLDPSGQWMVVERHGRALLCDARSLKPIRDIGVLPESTTPSSVIAFSSDGLLMAHPALDVTDAQKLVWHLRDAKSGEIIRSSEPFAESSRRPLAAFLDRKECKVMHSDGSLWVMPVSPLQPCRWEDAKEPLDLKYASYTPDGQSAHVWAEKSPHDAGQVMVMPSGAALEESAELLKEHPWSLQPSVWNGLYRGFSRAPRVDGDCMWVGYGNAAPIRCDARISAAHQSSNHVIVANERGHIDFYRTMALPLKHGGKHESRVVDASVLVSLQKIACALTGLGLDAKFGEFVNHDAEARFAAARACDFDLLSEVFPEVDFSGFREALDGMEFRQSNQNSVSILVSRLAEADPESAGDGAEIAELLASGDVPRIIASIESVDPGGAAAAKHLQFALASSDASLIDACLRYFSDMPAVLQRLAHSRIAWLQQRKADAIASWPEPFPEYESIRLAEDWKGWEQADFASAFHALRECVAKEIDSLKLPPEPSVEQLQALAARFEDQETMRAVGRTRYAKACIDAAFGFCKFKDHGQTALLLATRARNLGHAPEPCLRAEAMAYTALGDYRKAHDRWLLLITEFPVAAHESGDYAEAAYTAFESSDARQAMEILITGMHRFPRDADFALRAGWIALLTDHDERAYRFLLGGQQIGYRAEKVENATALLAIAAMQCGAKDDASAYYVKLVESDPAWKDAKTIEALDWPVELKSALESVRASTSLIAPTR
jgi:tetratricopeptide (TPR) repeat protein